jgi:polar amino acid transport system substrate-binding protein
VDWIPADITPQLHKKDGNKGKNCREKYIMKKYFTAYVILILFCVSSTAFAENTIVVAINDTPPWKMMVDGKVEGVDINITNKLLSKLNIKPIYRMAPFKRCLQDLRHGEADIMGFLTYKDERTKFLKYFQPPYQGDVKIFYVRKGEKERLKQYEDLYRLKVGLIRGHKHYEPFDSDPKIMKEQVSRDESNYKKIVAGRIDALIDNDTQGPYNAYRFGMVDKIEIAPYKVPLGKNGYFAMSKKSKYMDRFSEFENVLKEMVETGEVDKIIKDSLKRYEADDSE